MSSQFYSNSLSYTSHQFDSQIYLQDNKVFHKFEGQTARILDEMQRAGILDQLVSLGFIPPFEKEKNTQVGQVTFVQPLGSRIFPKEWPFSLIAHAGFKLLELQKFLDSKGYGLLDCHPYNFVLFHGGLFWVDLGSFVKKQDTRQLLFNEPEFLRNYILPLKIAQSGMPRVARAMLAPELPDADSLVETEILTSIKLRMIHKNIILWRIRTYIVTRIRAPFRVNQLNTKRTIFPQLIMKIAVKSLTLCTRMRLRKWSFWLNKTSRSIEFNQYWSDYSQENGALPIESSIRFRRISEIIKELSPKSIIDVGGNSGELLDYVVKWKSHGTKSYTVLDYDDGAIERGRRLLAEAKYQSHENADIHINHFYFDFANPWLSNFSSPLENRVQGDVVLALGLTHHLLLGQHMSISTLLERLNRMSAGHLLIEFMPLGLYSGGAIPELPDWYTVNWFKQNLSEFFTILKEEKLEINRLLFLASKK